MNKAFHWNNIFIVLRVCMLCAFHFSGKNAHLMFVLPVSDGIMCHRFVNELSIAFMCDNENIRWYGSCVYG